MLCRQLCHLTQRLAQVVHGSQWRQRQQERPFEYPGDPSPILAALAIEYQWRLKGLQGLGPKSSAGPLFANFLLTKFFLILFVLAFFFFLKWEIFSIFILGFRPLLAYQRCGPMVIALWPLETATIEYAIWVIAPVSLLFQGSFWLLEARLSVQHKWSLKKRFSRSGAFILCMFVLSDQTMFSF